jgi:hypothetical protein
VTSRVLLFAAALAVVSAPAAPAAEWMTGARAGIAISDFGGDDVEGDIGNREGFVGGLFAQVAFSPQGALRIEGLYHMKGASQGEGGATLTFKMDYIEFPLLLTGMMAASDAVTLSVFAGPVFGFTVGSELEARSSNGNTATLDLGDVTHGFEVSAVFGVGVGIDVGSAVVTLDGRYQLGFSSIDDGIGTVFGDSDEILNVENRGWAILAGVGFPIRSR